MARSKHTRPRRIRAAERVRDPRGARDVLPPARALTTDWPLPRIVETKPRAGFVHPASRANVVALLRFLGEPACYGLRTIALTRGTSTRPGEELGRLVGPGEIDLYDQPPSPWLLPGQLAPEEAARLAEAGARVEDYEGGGVAVHWTETALRDFLLLNVLLHEIGHHVLQHESRRPAVRGARTRDHEAFADRFARRWQVRWRASRKAP